MGNNLSSVDFADALLGMSACPEAREWAEGLDYETAWNTCSKTDWLFFLTRETTSLSPIQNEQLICRFAREILHLTTDPRVLACIEVREAWIRGEVSDEVRETAMAATWAITGVCAWAAAEYFAWHVAEYVVDAARAAARAAARGSAWGVAGAAAWAAAWATMKTKQCDIIRELVPRPLLS